MTVFTSDEVARNRLINSTPIIPTKRIALRLFQKLTDTYLHDNTFIIKINNNNNNNLWIRKETEASGKDVEKLYTSHITALASRAIVYPPLILYLSLCWPWGPRFSPFYHLLHCCNFAFRFRTHKIYTFFFFFISI